MRLFRVISRLLDYPQPDLWQHQDELLQEANGNPPLVDFIRALTTLAPLEAEARWVAQFERGRGTSLLLFEHVHGESRDRGQAMVDLLACYAAVGLTLDKRELPDYLPLYLEYLSQLDEAEACNGLQDIAPILALVAARLAHQKSPYAVLFDAMLALANYIPDSASLRVQVSQEPDDRSAAAVDAVWQEEQVRFASDGGCDNAQQQRQHHYARQPDVQYLDLTAGEPK